MNNSTCPDACAAGIPALSSTNAEIQVVPAFSLVRETPDNYAGDMTTPFELWANEVLGHYPAPLNGPVTHLGSHGGFSGARLWRLQSKAGDFCLKAWPTAGPSPRELSWIHTLQARAAHCPWMPHVVPTSDGLTFVEHQDRLWEIQTWMPGVADFASAPSPARLQSSLTALAELHQIWRTAESNTGICPAVVRRLESLQTWQQLTQTGWRPRGSLNDPYATRAEVLWHHVQIHFDETIKRLMPWLTCPVTLQPCVCDVWHDHVLFTGNTVTGIIDFGSAKMDHIAVDLARLLGSFVGNDANQWNLGYANYERVRPLSAEDRDLARDLDRSGVVVAATHWLRWLYHEGRTYERPDLVMQRLNHLVVRLRG